MTTVIPTGLATGTWVVDPTHSEISFTVRHLMSKVRGVFREFEGSVEVADDELLSSAVATVQLSSVDTGAAQRDTHLRSSDFFDVETRPEMTFASHRVERDGDSYVLHGDLTINAVTKPVRLAVEVLGVQVNPYGMTVAGFEASGSLNRKDFGIDWNVPLEGGALLVGDKVTLGLTIQAVRQEAVFGADSAAA